MSEKQSIVIIGAGIMGAATSYYLTHSHHYDAENVKVHLIEETGIASGASGKSGGFLALDWHGPETTPLGDLSYKLHADLAARHGGSEKWGYRPTASLSITARQSEKTGFESEERGGDEDAWLAGIGGIRHRGSAVRDQNGHAMLPESLAWIDPGCISGVTELGSTQTTAQVDPEALTKFLVEESISRGLDLIHGKATSISYKDGKISVVGLHDGTSIACDKVVLAAGPWTGRLYDTLFASFPDRRPIPISGFAGTSLLLKSAMAKDLSAHAIFGSLTMSDGTKLQPEFFSRGPNDEIWIGGLNEYSELPDHAGLVKPNPDHVRSLREASQVLCGKDVRVTREALCYRPVNRVTERPIMGEVTQGVPKGVYICAGHAVWGIALATGSGMVMSELLLQGKTSTDISALAP